VSRWKGRSGRRGQIAARRGVAVSALLTAIDAERRGNLASAIRVFVLDSCRRGELSGGENGAA